MVSDVQSSISKADAQDSSLGLVGTQRQTPSESELSNPVVGIASLPATAAGFLVRALDHLLGPLGSEACDHLEVKRQLREVAGNSPWFLRILDILNSEDEQNRSQEEVEGELMQVCIGLRPCAWQA